MMPLNIERDNLHLIQGFKLNIELHKYKEKSENGQNKNIYSQIDLVVNKNDCAFG